MFEKMEEWALLYVTGFLPKGGPKIAIPPDTLIANQLIQRDTRVGTLFVPTRIKFAWHSVSQNGVWVCGVARNNQSGTLL